MLEVGEPDIPSSCSCGVNDFGLWATALSMSLSFDGSKKREVEEISLQRNYHVGNWRCRS